MDAQIAIPYADGQIFPHLGKAARFKIYTVKAGRVASAEVADVDEGTSHADLALWLVWHAVTAVVCGNAGPGMQGALAGAGIALFAGASGAADEAVERLLAGTLDAARTATCAGGGCGGRCGHGCGGCGGR